MRQTTPPETTLAHTARLGSIALLVLLATMPLRAETPHWQLESPNRKILLTFSLENTGAKLRSPTYSVRYKNITILEPSPLGLELEGPLDLDAGLQVIDTARTSRDHTWQPVYGQWRSIRDHYNELTVTLQHPAAPQLRMTITFRAYDEGIAFCYTLTAAPQSSASTNIDITILREKTFFRFAADHFAWATYSAQGRYSRLRLSQLHNNCERPLTIELEPNLFVSLAEARLVDYARMRLSPAKQMPFTLVSSLASPVHLRTPYRTPWRVLLIADTPGRLLEQSYLILNLNDPCAIRQTDWIKPGKVIREVTLTTEGGKACVDFAVAHNLQYVEYDAGWYGHEYSDQADATTVSVDPRRSKGPLDLHAVIDYANRHGIGIILYVNRRALERQLDQILPLYESWGVKGVKFGFVQVGPQSWTEWLHQAVRKAAEHHLMVDIHDEYRPTGYSRTYPNLMTQEGIRGNECMPTAEENLVLPFTRMLAGAADYTICYYTDRIKTTHAHQLAASVVYYSPWQFLFWYDRPRDYHDEPEIEFFEHLPTTWDQLKVIHGKIGRYITIARRKGDQWFIVTMNARTKRSLQIPLEMLEPGKTYVAHIYSDTQPQPDNRTGVAIQRCLVDSTTVLQTQLAANGGQAVRLVPAQPKDLTSYPPYPGRNPTPPGTIGP